MEWLDDEHLWYHVKNEKHKWDYSIPLLFLFLRDSRTNSLEEVENDMNQDINNAR